MSELRSKLGRLCRLMEGEKIRGPTNQHRLGQLQRCRMHSLVHFVSSLEADVRELFVAPSSKKRISSP